jgi:hypothetical protein
MSRLPLRQLTPAGKLRLLGRSLLEVAAGGVPKARASGPPSARTDSQEEGLGRRRWSNSSNEHTMSPPAAPAAIARRLASSSTASRHPGSAAGERPRQDYRALASAAEDPRRQLRSFRSPPSASKPRSAIASLEAGRGRPGGPGAAKRSSSPLDPADRLLAGGNRICSRSRTSAARASFEGTVFPTSSPLDPATDLLAGDLLHAAAVRETRAAPA